MTRNENGYVNTGFDLNGSNLDEIKTVEGNNEESPPNATDPSNNVERALWDKPIEFLVSCIAMNVGLGNIWRFPFVAYENGGGAFLIPYILVLLIMGRPMYYLEACLGQFSSRGNVKMFENLAPALKGVGFGQLIGTVCVATYYCSLMAITLFYLVNSFTTNLPWATCDPTWNTLDWVQNGNITCVPSNANNVNASALAGPGMSSAELFFRIEVLKEYVNISNGIGAPEWRLFLCLLVSWAITFAICAKGIKSSGKAAYFLAFFPYVIIFTLLIRAVTLDGSGTGILYFVTPKWEQLLNAKVWYSAMSQCFFSLNIGFGSVSMYASYNGFRHNVYRDAMVVTTLDTITSFLSGTIIFGILGNLAFKMNVDVSEVVQSGGTGLAFISYPEAIARFEAVPWLFAILFFVMLFVLGIGSLVALVGCAFTVILDAFPHLKNWHVSLATSVAGLIIGLVYIVPICSKPLKGSLDRPNSSCCKNYCILWATRFESFFNCIYFKGGQWIFTMVDFFGGTFIFYVINIMEVTAVMWWYGLENICLDIEFMTKRKPGIYWRLCWGVVIPVTLFFVLIYFLVTFEPLQYEQKDYPTKIIAWGWAILAFAIIQPIVWFIIELAKRLKLGLSRKETFEAMFNQSDWGPKDSKKNQKWHEFKILKNAERDLKLRNKLKEKLCILVGK